MSTPFQIDLAQVNVASVVQLVESEQLTGHLLVGDAGHVVFRSGDVVGAECRALVGADAALTLMMEAAGLCVFGGQETVEGTPLMSTMALLIDGARLSDDWSVLAPRVLSGEAVGDGPVAAVVGAFDGDRTVDEAVRASNTERVQVIDGLLDHLRDGHLRDAGPAQPDRVQSPSTSAPAPPLSMAVSPKPPEAPSIDPSLSFYDLLDASRSSLRSKDYSKAIQFLEAADVKQPGDKNVAQNLRRLRQLVSTRS